MRKKKIDGCMLRHDTSYVFTEHHVLLLAGPQGNHYPKIIPTGRSNYGFYTCDSACTAINYIFCMFIYNGHDGLIHYKRSHALKQS